MGFITGIETIQWDSGSGTSVTHYHGWQRLFPLFVSAFCFSWLFAIAKRNIIGWYIGSVVFILIILQIIFQGVVLLLSASNAADGWGALISQAIFALLLLLALVKWWLPKKREFQPMDGA